MNINNINNNDSNISDNDNKTKKQSTACLLAICRAKVYLRACARLYVG